MWMLLQLPRGWLMQHTSATWWPKLVLVFTQRRAPSWFSSAPITGVRFDTKLWSNECFQRSRLTTYETMSLSLPFSLPFYQFASNEAIQRTEAYEYAQSLGSQPCSLPNFQVLFTVLIKWLNIFFITRLLGFVKMDYFVFSFQVFKLIYACRLAEAGLSAQAFHYCEVISKTVLMQPSYYSPVFISQIIQVTSSLQLCSFALFHSVKNTYLFNVLFFPHRCQRSLDFSIHSWERSRSRNCLMNRTGWLISDSWTDRSGWDRARAPTNKVQVQALFVFKERVEVQKNSLKKGI